jgi:hypothetical protein
MPPIARRQRHPRDLLRLHAGFLEQPASHGHHILGIAARKRVLRGERAHVRIGIPAPLVRKIVRAGRRSHKFRDQAFGTDRHGSSRIAEERLLGRFRCAVAAIGCRHQGGPDAAGCHRIERSP